MSPAAASPLPTSAPADARALALADLPQPPPDVRRWRILLLVSAINSLTQRVLTHLADLGFDAVSTELALSDDDMYGAVIAHSPHLVLCPFLVKKVPDGIFRNVTTLIVHPGPPGDAGPAALDWAILGDRGIEADAAEALKQLQAPVDRSLPLAERQRTFWGITVLQADETLDGGPVWAFDQFALPDVATLTKSSLYQNQVSSAVLRAVTAALTRLGESFAVRCNAADRATWTGVRADPRFARECVSFGRPFVGGPLHDRPQIKPGQRRSRLAEYTAADVARIVNCADSQPGATVPTAKSFLFVYDAHVHQRVADLPPDVRLTYDGAQPGDAVATRAGAVLFKTAACAHAHCAHGCGVAVWLTHGRVPKPANSGPLNPKVPLQEAMVAAGEGASVDVVPEWPLVEFAEREGTWQQTFVRSVTEGDAVIQLVYWDFYNGAFSTAGCQLLLRVLQWAADTARGNVKLLALMGGAYFSNGVALNIIEAAVHPGHETWANINAIDDVVEFLAGDTSTERSGFLSGRDALAERGIVTAACVRGNAAAGGVALAAACDIVLAANSVVLNPAYRAMGLHGSELHLYSYVARCGRDVATHLVRDMLPLSASNACDLGLVDAVVGGRDVGRDEAEALLVDRLRLIARGGSDAVSSDWFASAPWIRPCSSRPGTLSETRPQLLVDALCDNKRTRYAAPDHVPLVHYRHEELSQMLLDSFHPVRSARYHARRIKFVRKVKAGKTPNRFVRHRVHAAPDDEDDAAFDDAPGWVRGDEWTWVGDVAPASLATSAHLRIDFADPVDRLPLPRAPRRPFHLSQMTDDSQHSAASGTTDASSSLHTDSGVDDDASIVEAPSACAAIGQPLSPPPSAALLLGSPKMLMSNHRESLGTAVTGALAQPVPKLRPALHMPRSTSAELAAPAPAAPAQRPVAVSLPVSALHVKPMSTSLPAPPPIVLTADLSKSRAQPRTKRPSREVFGTATATGAPPPPHLEHVLVPAPANTPAGKAHKLGRFATLSKLLRPRREGSAGASPSPTLTSEHARLEHLAPTQQKLALSLASSPARSPSPAPSPVPRARALDTQPAALALGTLHVDADTYDRPVVANEGDTESPCFFNTADVAAFPAVPERPAAVRV